MLKKARTSIMLLVILLLVVGITSRVGASTERILFADDFSNDLAQWSVNVGDWSIDNGLLRGHGWGGVIDAWIYAGEENWTDYSLRATAYLDSGNAEFVLRSTGHWLSEYRVTLWSSSSPEYANSYQIYKYKPVGGGVIFTDGNQHTDVEITDVVNVRIDIVGPTISLYVNDQFVGEATDPNPLPAGRIGLGVIWNWTGHFDNVRVVDLTMGSPPSIISISGPTVPQPVNTSLPFSAIVTDADVDEPLTATWDWGDGSVSVDPVLRTGAEESIASIHNYTTPGVYKVQLTIVDEAGGTATKDYPLWVVIYDPNGGFITGGGWIFSPAGAYAVDPGLSGKASFGFVSKYKKGTIIPEGSTEFQFKAGDLNFKSVNYEWLVVAGQKGKFKGTGTINGQPGYKFILSAIDGAKTSNPDKLRIKIWQDDTAGNEIPIYDNQMGASGESDLLTDIGGGEIVIHKP